MLNLNILHTLFIVIVGATVTTDLIIAILDYIYSLIHRQEATTTMKPSIVHKIIEKGLTLALIRNHKFIYGESHGRVRKASMSTSRIWNDL